MLAVGAAVRDIPHALGLDRFPPLYRDGLFLTALLAGSMFWLSLWLLGVERPMRLPQIFTWDFLSLTLWQPFLEELLFRGGLQGQISRHAWGQKTWKGVTTANAITSLGFMLGHWWRHQWFWALAVIIPSLIFGFFRDRYTNVYPAMALHMFYNVGFFLLMGLPGSQRL